MMPKLPSRAALFVPLLSLGLLVPGFNADLTRADTLPAPCELAAAAIPAEVADDVIFLSAILPPDVDLTLAATPPRPRQGGPSLPDVVLPPGAPKPPGEIGVPKPIGANLPTPDPALLNLEPIMAARQLRESLTERQEVDLRAVLTKHQDRLQQVRTRLPGLPAQAQGNKPVKADQEAGLSQVSAEVTSISDQIDQDIERLLTPAQRALLQKARPQRLRAEQTEPSDVVVADSAPGC
jgi:hypothetical protein